MNNEITHLVLSPASGQQQSQPTVVKQLLQEPHTLSLQCFQRQNLSVVSEVTTQEGGCSAEPTLLLSSLSQAQRPACLPVVSVEPKCLRGFRHLQEKLAGHAVTASSFTRMPSAGG